MSFKRQLAGWLRRSAPLRWLLALAVRLFIGLKQIKPIGYTPSEQLVF